MWGGGMSRSRNSARLLPDNTGILPAINAVSGSIIQAVSTYSGALTQTTSSSDVPTGLAATITPKKLNSQILILITARLYTNIPNSDIFVSIYRNTSLITKAYSIYNSGGALATFSAFHYIDTPNVLSPLLYQLYIANTNNTSYVGINPNGINSPSFITLLEISP